MNSSKKILLAEDEFLVAELLKALLKRRGYEIIYASDGREAIERIKEELPDLIVTDRMMPRADGIAVCRFLRDEVGDTSVPIILMSAAARPDVDDRLFDAYVEKPFRGETLVDLIEQLLPIDR